MALPEGRKLDPKNTWVSLATLAVVVVGAAQGWRMVGEIELTLKELRKGDEIQTANFTDIRVILTSQERALTSLSMSTTQDIRDLRAKMEKAEEKDTETREYVRSAFRLMKQMNPTFNMPEDVLTTR